MRKTTTKPKAAKAVRPATPPAATPAAKASDHAPGDLVQFYCPSAGRVVTEKVTGTLDAENYVTVESGRHFPAHEVSPVEETE